MALLTAEFIATVKERTRIEDVVREHVTLTSAGPGSYKGLCPFHDEKTASFYVRPAVGSWHCFGCGEGGDVISFVEKLEHLSFAETIERLAGRLGLEPVYEEGSGPAPSGEGIGRRSRLIEAHRVAQELYAEALLRAPNSRTARDFMRSRGFDGKVATAFGIGFSPRGGEVLVATLRAKGFTEEELVSSGLAARGSRGLYDRFRGRLMWPINDITGSPIGFGARRLFDDDRIEAKYLNTAETAIYKKSTVLYGLDLAKKAIASSRQAVVVEGYTDVMSCHLAGVATAVATCGTAFGLEHIKVLRRLMRDEADGAGSPARVIFTFDGDAAGQAAAMKAFGEDQRWATQSFVAVEPSGKDPNELRMAGGDLAVKALVEDAVPLFEFALRTTIKRFDLTHAEGRIQAMRAVAPIIAGIRDNALRPEYVREVSGWLGLTIDQLHGEVARAVASGARPAFPTTPARQNPVGSSHPATSSTPADLGDPPDPGDASLEPSPDEERGQFPPPNLRDPAVLAERQLLQCLLQYPFLLPDGAFDQLGAEALSAPAHRAVLAAMQAVGELPGEKSLAAWHSRVAELAPRGIAALLAELSVAPIPVRAEAATGYPPRRFVAELLGRVREAALTRAIADAMSRLRRLGATGEADPDALRLISVELTALQREHAALREQEAN